MTSETMTSDFVRYDEARRIAREFLAEHAELLRPEVVMVRDLRGRIRIALDDRADFPLVADDLREWGRELDRRLGGYSPGAGSIFLRASELFAPDEIFGSEDLLDFPEARYRVLDRALVGADWLRPPFEERPSVPRITLFGIKGGLGRSTAAAVLGWRLCQRGHTVLIVDLDLESPGVGTTLLPDDRMPEVGVLDWFVEDAVGQADERLVESMAAASPLSSEGNLLWVVPTGGKLDDDYDYLGRLSRAYSGLGGPGERESDDFADRLHALIRALEEHLRPDVVLLDSRAGLHDIAAVAVTRLGATSLLFGIDTAQTWQGYRALFKSWRDHHDRARHFRSDLQMVAAQIPETGTAKYLAGFQQQAFDLFSENLYEEVESGEFSDFNFSFEDPSAPHVPWRIHWSRTFQQFDPVRQQEAVTDEQLRAAFGDLVNDVESLIERGEDFS